MRYPVQLAPIAEGDYPLLRKWRNASDFLHLCSQQENIVSEDEFRKELEVCFWRDRHWQSIIRDRRGNALGTVFSYNYSKRDSFCFVTIYLAEQKRIGLGIHALSMFTRALVNELSLYKIYFDVYEFNFDVIAMLERAEIPLEGRFRGQRLMNGKRYDTLRFALYPDKLRQFFRAR